MKTTFFQVILLMFFGLIMFDANAQMYKEETAFPFRISLMYNAINEAPSMIHVKDAWSIPSYPSRVGVEAFVSRDLSIEAAFSYNEYLPGNSVNGQVIQNKILNHSYDLNLKYSMRNLFGGGNPYKSTFISHFDPYVSLGAGYTHIDGKEYLIYGNETEGYTYGPEENNLAFIILGGGVVYWFSKDDESYYNNFTDRIGVVGQAQMKTSIDDGNLIQLSLGLIYKFK